MGETVQEYLRWQEVAEVAARQAGAFLLERPAQPHQVMRKGERELVTDADYTAQAIITDRIRREFPGHAFLAEEKDDTLASSGRVCWIVDPIDGTSNYSRTYTNFCVSIGVSLANQIVAGVVYDPRRDELFSATAGRGSRLNGRPIQISDTPDLAQAMVGFDWSRTYEHRQATLTVLSRLVHQVRTLRTVGSAGLTLAWVAAGRLDAYLIFHLHLWDMAAGSLLVREAGGAVSRIDGQATSLVQETSILATNGILHGQLLATTACVSGS